MQRGKKRAAALPVTVGFDGIGSNNYQVPVVPPDPNASVGTTQIVETVNTAFAVYSKSGATIMGPTDTNTLWAGFGGPCQTTNDGDATVRWDVLAGRWVITQFAGAASTTGPFYQCVAVSNSADATGTYNRYAFSYTNFNDYPKLSVWPDAYYVTYNMFNPAKTAFLGAKVCALDRAQMLTGAPATQQCFDTDSAHSGLLGADLDGSTPPPSGEPNLLVGLNTNTTLAYWKFHVDWTTPGNSTFTGPSTLSVAPYTVACNSFADLVCVPQGGTTQTLDALSDRLMYRLAYRNYGTHESLVVNHSVQAGTSSGVRWYELRLSGGNPTVYQQGTYAPDATWRWMGSAAQDRMGNMAVGYSQSSSATFPSIRFTGRLAGDPLGTLPIGETTIQNGGGSQTGNVNAFRWGDYTSMAVDPTDDCTFWYTNQYQPTTGVLNWHTRIASFNFPDCPARPSLTIGKSHSGNFTQGGTGDYTITVGNSGPGATDGTTVSVHDTLPAGLTASSISGSGWTCTLATLTCTRSDVLAAGSSYPSITLTVNVAGDAPAQVTNTVTTTGGGDSTTHTATDPTTISPTQPSLTIGKSHSGNFTQGGTGIYTITVGNSGPGTTDGTTVSVHDTLPAGLTASSISGSGWTCTLATLTCTRSDVLAAGSSYPSITLTVKVSCRTRHRDIDTATRGHEHQVTNTATVSGGGDTTTHTATDTVTIKDKKHCGKGKEEGKKPRKEKSHQGFYEYGAA